MLTYLKQQLRRHLSGNPISENDRERILSKIHNNEVIDWELETRYIKDDFEIMHAAVSKKIVDIIYYVSDRLKDCEPLIHTAVKNGYSLMHASHRLQNNKSIVEIAINNNPAEIRYASSILQNNSGLLDKALDSGLNIGNLSEQLKSNITLALKVLTRNGELLKYFNDDIKNDKKAAHAALIQTRHAIKYISSKLKEDYNLMLEFIEDDTFFNAGENLRNDPDFLINVIYKLKEQLNRSNNRDGWFITNAVERYINRDVIQLILEHDIFQQDWPIIKQALLQAPDTMLHPPAILKTMLEDQANYLVTLANYVLTDESRTIPTDLPDLTM